MEMGSEMANLLRFKIWLQVHISPFFVHFSSRFHKIRNQILQCQHVIDNDEYGSQPDLTPFPPSREDPPQTF